MDAESRHIAEFVHERLSQGVTTVLGDRGRGNERATQGAP